MLGLLMSLSLVYPLSMLVSPFHRPQSAAYLVLPQYLILKRLSLQACAVLRLVLAPSFLTITYAFCCRSGALLRKGRRD